MSEPMPPAPEEMHDDALDRASERRSFFLNTTLSLAGQGVFQARVRNLSAGGMMVELEQAPEPEWAPGDRLSAELRNIGIVKGEIAWAGGRRFGVRFDRAVDPELARQPVSTGKDVTPDYLKPVLVARRPFNRLAAAMKGGR